MQIHIIDKAHINIVEASDNATVVQGEQLASYDKAVVFDLEDTIEAVLSSTSLSSNNYADVRDIVITNSTLATDAMTLIDAANTGAVTVDVLDDADNVAAEVTGSNGAGDLDEANTVVVSGGDVDAAEAAAIQSISGYDGSASDYDITDTAAALISATDSVLNVDGVDTVSVTGGPVDADTGEKLAELSKDVEFDVLDDSRHVAAEVTGSNGAGDLR